VPEVTFEFYSTDAQGAETSVSNGQYFARRVECLNDLEKRSAQPLIKNVKDSK